MHRALRPILWAIAASFSTACHVSPPPRAVAQQDEQPIVWQRFTAEAFATARREHKVVLVDVGIEGCIACHWMLERTYRDPEVRRLVREHFVAVAVDADVEPDLGARYVPWGWPATIFLTDDAKQVEAIEGSLPARDFIPVLDDVIQRQARGMLENTAAKRGPPSSADVPLHASCVESLAEIDADANATHGGWPGKGRQYVNGDDMAEGLLRAHVTGDDALRAHALKTLEGYARLIDPVWGGVYVEASKQDFTAPEYEKRILHEAYALQGFASAYALTGDSRWRQRVQEVDRYVRAFLRADDGTFYSTQQQEPPNLPAALSREQYFAMGNDDRRRYGVPAVDHAVYTDQNGVIIAAYADVYEQTGDTDALSLATLAAERLLQTRMQAAGYVSQTAGAPAVPDQRLRVFQTNAKLYLAPQVGLGLALVRLHRVTGQARWLDAAARIGRTMLSKLEDPEGGFFAAEGNPGVDIIPRLKPVAENLSAVRFLHELSVDLADPGLAVAAERALHAVSPRARSGPALALAVQEVTMGPIEMTVAGEPGDPRAQALFDAALRVYEPRKALHFDVAGRYPRGAVPSLYVCTRSACSSPIHEPNDVKDAARRYARSSGGPCP